MFAIDDECLSAQRLVDIQRRLEQAKKRSQTTPSLAVRARTTDQMRSLRAWVERQLANELDDERRISRVG